VRPIEDQTILISGATTASAGRWRPRSLPTVPRSCCTAAMTARAQTPCGRSSAGPGQVPIDLDDVRELLLQAAEAEQARTRPATPRRADRAATA
jgi:hypothetical protein